MFKNTFQSGFLSVLYSIGSKPLQIWDKQVRNFKNIAVKSLLMSDFLVVGEKWPHQKDH